MSNLLRAEMYKLRRNKTFWVLIFTMIVFSSFAHYLIVSDWWFMSGTPFDHAGLSELNALSVFMTPLYFNFVVSTLAGFYISVEFSQNSVIKNQIISGHKRKNIFLAKYVIFSVGAFIVTVLIPFVTALMIVMIMEGGALFAYDPLLYLLRAYGIFTIAFFSFTALVFVIAILTEESGKTILFTFLISAIMFVVEILGKKPFIQTFYEHTFFYQFNVAFQDTLSNGEMIQSLIIGLVSLILILLFGMFMFNRKEIN